VIAREGKIVLIEPLEEKHLPQAHALSAALGWPHRVEDWRFVLGLGHGLAAIDGDRLQGTLIWWPFGARYATLGMVIVDSALQGRGLGRRLMVAALQQTGDRTVLLNATAQGRPLYEKLGFEPIGTVRQHQAANLVAASELPARAMTGGDLRTIATLDAQAAGFERDAMLEALASAGQGLVLERDGTIAAWSFFRRFGRGYVIGPVGAREGALARGLVASWIARYPADFLRVDTPAAQGLSSWLEATGLPQVGEVVTMVRGTPPPSDAAGPRLFALASQALG
jgi:GNAT superfamily N-acetyltransferase